MSEAVCSQCSGSRVVHERELDALICGDCGYVLEDTRLESAVTVTEDGPAGVLLRSGDGGWDAGWKQLAKEYGGGTALARAGYKLGQASKQEAERRLTRVAAQVQLPQSDFEQAAEWLQELISCGVAQGRNLNTLTAAVVYSVACDNHRALSLSQCADAVQTSEHAVGRMAAVVRRQLGVAVEAQRAQDFLPRAAANVRAFRRPPEDGPGRAHAEPAPAGEGPAPAALPCPAHAEPTQENAGKVRVQRAVEYARRVVEWMGEQEAFTGCRPRPVAAAALQTAADMLRAPATLAEVCRELQCAEATARQRYRELQRALLEVARQRLPWGAGLGPQDLREHLPFLGPYLEPRCPSSPAAALPAPPAPPPTARGRKRARQPRAAQPSKRAEAGQPAAFCKAERRARQREAQVAAALTRRHTSTQAWRDCLPAVERGHSVQDTREGPGQGEVGDAAGQAGEGLGLDDLLADDLVRAGVALPTLQDPARSIPALHLALPDSRCPRGTAADDEAADEAVAEQYVRSEAEVQYIARCLGSASPP